MRRLFIAGFVCAAIAGCDSPSDGAGLDVDSADARAYSLFDPVAATASLCGGPAIPFPNNALFASTTNPTGVTPDTTLNIPSAASTVVAANLTDGFSTTASMFTDFLGLIDYSTAAASVVIVEADATPRILVPGTDYTVQPSIAMAQASGTGGGCVTNGVDPNTFYNFANLGPSTFIPIAQQFRSRLLIEPLKPLNPSTVYLVAVTTDLMSADGVPAARSQMFEALNRSTKLCRLAPGGVPESGTEVLCSDPDAPDLIAGELGLPMLGELEQPSPAPPNPPLTGPTAAAVRLTTLETLRRNLVYPGVAALKNFAGMAIPGGPIALTDDDIVIAWSFTTQSTNATLATMMSPAVTSAKSFAVVDTTVSTGDLGAGLADTANIWSGRLLAVPYYLDDASSATDAASQCMGTGTTTPGVTCNGFWGNDGTVTSTAAGGFVPWTPLADYDGAGGPLPVTPAPCALGGATPFNWAAPLSTTNCFRIPLARSTEDLPVMITVPNDNVCAVNPTLCGGDSVIDKPANGWPVVIFQHGITGNRTQMLALAPTLATGGFVTIAIDLPLHGLIGPASPTNPFYQTGFERTFDLDIVTNASGAACATPPCDTTDSSGTHFINLGSLITSRDNLRQAVADLIHLTKSVKASNLDFDGSGEDIDETKVYFAGISLGAIVGTTYLGVDTGASAAVDGADELINAASLHVPGGGLGKLLDASASFGPRIAAGLAGTAFSPTAPTNGAGSPFEGTDTYETFVRFAQHLIDPADPINFAVSANLNHPLHMTMVTGDTVVPNNAITTCPAIDTLPSLVFQAADNTLAATRDAACDAGIALAGTNAATQPLCNANVAAAGACPAVVTGPVTTKDEVIHTGFLSGTQPLYTLMGLTVAATQTPPGTAGAGAADTVVPFTFGIAQHGSLLTPDADGTSGNGNDTAFICTTREMQRETTTFFVTDGAGFTLGGTTGAPCP